MSRTFLCLLQYSFLLPLYFPHENVNTFIPLKHGIIPHSIRSLSFFLTKLYLSNVCQHYTPIAVIEFPAFSPVFHIFLSPPLLLIYSAPPLCLLYFFFNSLPLFSQLLRIHNLSILLFLFLPSSFPTPTFILHAIPGFLPFENYALAV